jgi:predicted O-linked N-acetylglucosamine transferase (SPINDLY family)
MRSHRRDTNIAYLLDRALRFHRAARYDKAVKCYTQALAIDGRNAELLNNCGIALKELERYNDALVHYDRALAINHNYAEAHNNRANVLKELKRLEEALASYDRALHVRPAYANAMIGRGTVLQELKRHEEALASYNKALAIQPRSALGFFARGTLLQEMGRRTQALTNYDQALSIYPTYAEAHCNRGVVLLEMAQYEKALASFERALAIRPVYAKALFNYGSVLLKMGRYDEARQVNERVLAIEPRDKYALDALVEIARNACDWNRADALTDKLIKQIQERTAVPNPFTLLSSVDDPAFQLQCARRWLHDAIPILPAPMCTSQRWRNDKIRVAYISPDLRQHPVGYLLVKAIECHDRARFEAIAVSTGLSDGSEIHARLVKAFDQFHNVFELGDHDIAKLLRELRVDIAVDLAGPTASGRPGILAHRPAPIQVNYLGYPGTMGADFIDYIIADHFLIPVDAQRFYFEKIVYLPDTFQANDSKRLKPASVPIRSEVGLLDGNVVFCAFNSSYKINLQMFAVWMRLLQNIEGSILWLIENSSSVVHNLRREAAARGIDAERLVFAPRASYADYLSRYRLADIFLDTLPFNGGTTASDALWMGLPIVSCAGTAFSSRMSGSLLHAIGLPELVTSSLGEYEALALQLARDAPLLANTKAKLAHNRDTYPLFNSKCFTRHLETAYTTMWEIWQRDEKPQSFAVPS